MPELMIWNASIWDDDFHFKLYQEPGRPTTHHLESGFKISLKGDVFELGFKAKGKNYILRCVYSPPPMSHDRNVRNDHGKCLNSKTDQMNSLELISDATILVHQLEGFVQEEEKRWKTMIFQMPLRFKNQTTMGDHLRKSCEVVTLRRACAAIDESMILGTFQGWSASTPPGIDLSRLGFPIGD